MNSSPTERREDKGFTLIELMVVVLIIAILLAIAIPTFLGAQNKAKDRSAQSSARNALTNAKTIFADTGVYSDVTVAKLTASEPSLKFVVGPSTGPKVVSVIADVSLSATVWYGAVLSETNTCFYIVDAVAAGASPSTLPAGTSYAKIENSSKLLCDATATLPAPPTGGTQAVYTDKW